MVHKWTCLGEVQNNIYASSVLNSFIYAIKHALLIYFQKLTPFLSRQNSMLFMNCACILSGAAQRHTLDSWLFCSLCCPRAARYNTSTWLNRSAPRLPADAHCSKYLNCFSQTGQLTKQLTTNSTIHQPKN